MIVVTKRSRLRYLFDLLLTVLGWLAFVYLFVAGILAILHGDVRGIDAPILPAQLLDSVRTVLGYIILMLIGALILVAWARYNQRRFTGKDRRKRAAAPSDAQLQVSFQVSDKQYDDAQNAEVMLVYHDAQGQIRAIEKIEQTRKSDDSAEKDESTRAIRAR